MTTTTQTYLDLHPLEAAAWSRGATMIVLPMDEQPDGADTGGPYIELDHDDGLPPKKYYMPLLHPPGSIIAGREAWRVAECYDMRNGESLKVTRRNIEYASGDQFLGAVGGRQRPASDMPDWAIRHYRRVLKVQARQVQSVTEDEAIAAGIAIDGEYLGQTAYHRYDSRACSTPDPRESFTTFIDTIHPGTWAANKWCWFIATEVMSCP